MAGAHGKSAPPGTSRPQRHRVRPLAAAAAALLVVVVAAGGFVVVLADRDGAGRDDRGRAARTAAPRVERVVAPNVATEPGRPPMRAASTRGGDIPVHRAPDPAAELVGVLPAQTAYLFPRTLLAFDEYGEWLHVYVPARPNGGTGWVRRTDVELSAPLEWEIRVSLADYRLWLLRDGVVEFETEVAIGTARYPTPTGTFFVTDPIDLHDRPNLGYGVFALGLSGYSDVLFEFMGGDGQIAIHGTNNPGDVGRAVSHGCVRVTNAAIERLSGVPLGTPVVIT